MKNIVTLVIILCTLSLHAQQDIGTHFMKNIVQSNYTNPSVFNKYRTNVSLPSAQLGYYNSVFQLQDIYQSEGNTLTLDFGNAINQMDDFDNLLQANAGVELLAASTQFGKLQVGIHYGLKTNATLSYPKGLFHFLWLGNADADGETLELGPGIDFNAYHEVGLNLAYKVEDNFSIGTRLRLLSGLYAVHTERSDIELVTDQSNYNLTANTDYSLWSAGLQFDSSGGISTSRAVFENLFSNNKGFALDLGATYRLMDGKLELQASVLDLGSITWDDNINETQTQSSFDIVAFDLAALVNEEDAETAVIDTLKQVFNFETKSTSNAFKTNLGAKTYLSATYQPSKGLYLGALLYGAQNRTGFSPTFALSARKEFSNILSLGAVFSARKNSIDNLGLNATLRFAGLQFFATTDNVLSMLDIAKGNNYNLRVGLNIALGNPVEEDPIIPLIDQRDVSDNREILEKEVPTKPISPPNPTPSISIKEEVKQEIPTIAHHDLAKLLSRGYTGYKIEVVTSPSVLPANHRIFNQFGNLMYEQKKNGQIAYLLGEFSKENSAQNFLKNIVSKQYPSARVVRYSSSNRVN